jgi:hemerythrin
MQIDWKDSYKIGNAQIDAEHQKAFQLANQFLAAQDQATLRVAAMQLYKHTREHFEHEEKMMRDRAYPDTKAHVDGHNRLISRLNVISQTVARNDVNDQALKNLMIDWTINHIGQDDARLAAFVTAQ